jgi:hypothetical protein
MNDINYCGYLENVSKLLSEKKISEGLAKEMLKSFNEMIQSMKEIEINRDNNLKEIEFDRNKTQKEILQVRCTESGTKITKLQTISDVANAVTNVCNTINEFDEPKPIPEQPIVNNQQPVG